MRNLFRMFDHPLNYLLFLKYHLLFSSCCFLKHHWIDQIFHKLFSFLLDVFLLYVRFHLYCLAKINHGLGIPVNISNYFSEFLLHICLIFYYFQLFCLPWDFHIFIYDLKISYKYWVHLGILGRGFFQNLNWLLIVLLNRHFI